MKENAKMLFLYERLTQKEIASRVGVSEVTIGKWVKDWESLKLNYTQTREQRIKDTLFQLAELDASISKKDEGMRFPTSKEADIRRKLTADLKDLETEGNIRDIIYVARKFLNWLRTSDRDKAAELSDYFDAFIKDNL